MTLREQLIQAIVDSLDHCLTTGDGINEDFIVTKWHCKEQDDNVVIEFNDSIFIVRVDQVQ